MGRAILFFATLLAAYPALAQDPIDWTISSAQPMPVAVGDIFEVEVSARIDRPWHLYALTQPVGGPVPLAITVPLTQPFTLVGNIDSPQPAIAHDPNFDIETQFFEEHAAFTVSVQVEQANAGRLTLTISVTYQVCKDTLCLPPTEEQLKLSVIVGSGTSTPVKLGEPVAADNSVEPEPPPSSRVPDMAMVSAEGHTLQGYVGLAMLMGALSLLTPCVFPMVPITVSYFTHRGQRSRRETVLQAVVYGLGIILTFTAVGFAIAVGFGASGLNRFAADPWLNLAVTALFGIFALSLFGVYELALPSRIVSVAAKADAGRGRYAGTMLMGLAFTLTSFTCTAPFLGALFVVASQGDWKWPIAGMFAFSSIFALPFVLLAIAPRLLWALPRSGVWLVAVKATMGLMELAAAFKFLSNADLVWGWGILTREVVIALWIAIAAVLMLYLAGALRLGRAPRLGRAGPARLAATLFAAAFIAWLATGFSGKRLGELEAFLPPADAAVAGGSELAWMTNDYEGALAEAKRQGQPVLVDFTGYTCTNCRWMEANMFPRPEISRELARYVRVKLYTDGRGEIHRRFQEMERQTFGTVALPYYAVLTPAGVPVVAFGGLTRDSGEYLNFLRKGLE